MKLLHSKIDILVQNSKFFVENNKWASKYIDIKIPDSKLHAEFAYLSDSDYQKWKKEMVSNMDQINLFFKETTNSPLKRFAGIITSIE